jgi:hypothetical protein
VAQWEFAYNGFYGCFGSHQRNLWLVQSVGEFLGLKRGPTKSGSFSGKSNNVCNHLLVIRMARWFDFEGVTYSYRVLVIVWGYVEAFDLVWVAVFQDGLV